MAGLGAVGGMNRNSVTQTLVDRMEGCLREQEAASADLKEVAADAKNAQFTKSEIAAMKKIATLRLKDQFDRAREHLDALNKIGKAVSFDLFDGDVLP